MFSLLTALASREKNHRALGELRSPKAHNDAHGLRLVAVSLSLGNGWFYPYHAVSRLCTGIIIRLLCFGNWQQLWRHQMETFSALLALWVRNSSVTAEFSAQRPVTWSFDVFFDLGLNKRLSKQSWGWWLEMPSRSWWRHHNVTNLPVSYAVIPPALVPSHDDSVISEITLKNMKKKNTTRPRTINIIKI